MVTRKNVVAKWLAALSSGDIVVEGKEPFHNIRGERSPWLRLRDFLATTGVRITGLRIQIHKDGEATRTYNLPSHNIDASGQHPKFRPFKRCIVPSAFGHRRHETTTRRSDGSLTTEEVDERYIEVWAEFPPGDYPDGLMLSLVVDENDGNEAWVVLQEKKSR
jgi:hypothetical protein